MSSTFDITDLYDDPDFVANSAKYRPVYPHKLTDIMIEYLSRKLPGPYKHAIDIGCGSGNSSRLLVDHFDHVTGVDPSITQLTVARELSQNIPNLYYMLGSAENIPVGDSSTDLVVCSLSLHFCDRDKFYVELNRVLKPGGCLAAYGFNELLLKHGETVVNLKIYTDKMEAVYKASGVEFPNMQLVKDKYRDISWPYQEVQSFEDVHGENEVSLSWLEEYWSTRLAHQSYIRKTSPENGKQLMEDLKTSMRQTLNFEDGAEEHLTIIVPLFLVMCRKPE